MKIYIVFLMMLSFNIRLFAQSSEKDNTGLFSALAGLKVKPAVQFSYFSGRRGENVYILQQDSHVVEYNENRSGVRISISAVIPFDDKSIYNLLLNLSLKDYKSISTDSNTGFYNSQTPFGIGVAVFPFDGARFFGFSVLGNIGRQNRMRSEALATQFFPIANHPDYGLKVGAPVPDGLLNPYYYKETTYSFSAGIIIRI